MVVFVSDMFDAIIGLEIVELWLMNWLPLSVFTSAGRPHVVNRFHSQWMILWTKKKKLDML